MFGANLKKGQALLQSILCPNGNCSQIRCLYRHVRPPVVLASENDRQPLETMLRERDRQDEELEAALAESLAISLSLCCSYCNGSFSTRDDLQMHQAGNCRAMEDHTGEEKNPHQNGEEILEEMNMSWRDQEEKEEEERCRKNEEKRKEIEVPPDAVTGKRPKRQIRLTWKMKEAEKDNQQDKKRSKNTEKDETLRKIREIRKKTGCNTVIVEKFQDSGQEERVNCEHRKALSIEKFQDSGQEERVGCEHSKSALKTQENGGMGGIDALGKVTKSSKPKVDEAPAMAKQKIELENGEDKDGKKKENMEEKQGLEDTNSSGEESDSSDDEEEMERMKEQLEKKETIIKDLQSELEVTKRETRETRLSDREKMEKLTSTLLDKEDYIEKLKKKILALGTKVLGDLEKKMVKNVHKVAQTDPVKIVEADAEDKKQDEVPDMNILSRLPRMNKLGHKEEQKKGRNILNVNITRGVKDKCLNCYDLEKKRKERTQACNQLKNQVKEYQEKLGRVNTLCQVKEHNNKEGNAAAVNSDEETDGERDKEKKEESKDETVKKNETGKKDETEKKDESENETEIKEAENGKDHRDSESNSDEESDEDGSSYNAEKPRLNRESQHVKRKDEEGAGSNENKDHSKLCNDFVWNGKCKIKYRKCKYTHKKLCRQLRKEGKCTKKSCTDGHNVDGICREYNKEKCEYNELTCRFLHIKVKTQEHNAGENIDGVLRRSRRESDREDNLGQKLDEDMYQEDHDPQEGKEQKDNNQEESDQEGKEQKDNNQEESDQEENDQEDADQEIGQGTRTMLQIRKEERKEKKGALQTNAEKEKELEERYMELEEEYIEIDAYYNEETAGIPDRNLRSFLQLDIRHDIWKDVQATMEEVKKLEKEIKNTRKQDGQNLYRID